MYPGLRPIVSSLVKPLGPRACAWSACVAMLAHTALPVAQPIAKASLPEPSGAFGVGENVVQDWVDIARQNPFASDSSARRELMVYLWYPTEPGQRTSASEYLPGARAIDVAPGSGRLRQSPLWPLIVAGSIASHAQARAPLARRPERFPVVVFSTVTASPRSSTPLQSKTSRVMAMSWPQLNTPSRQQPSSFQAERSFNSRIDVCSVAIVPRILPTSKAFRSRCPISGD